MDDRVGPAGARVSEASRPAVVVVHPEGHPVALAVLDRLRGGGCECVIPSSIYEAVIAIAREPSRFAAAVLAVDFYNRQELRFFPMAKRRWPGLRTAALSQPGFAYKAAVAELAGADVVCTEAGKAGEAVAALGLAEAEGAEAASAGGVGEEEAEALGTGRAGPPSAEAGEDRERAARASGAGEGRGEAARAGRTSAEVEKEERAPRARKKPSAGTGARPPVSAREILTEEEIAALMEGMGDEDLPPEAEGEGLRKNGTDDE